MKQRKTSWLAGRQQEREETKKQTKKKQNEETKKDQLADRRVGSEKERKIERKK